MNRRIEIFINQNRCEYFSDEKLPLSIRKAADKFLDLVGADGMEADNVARSLSLPASTRNLQIIEGAMQHNSTMKASAGQLTVVILVNGVPVFNGLGLIKSTARTARERQNIRIQLNGDGFSVWALIDKVGLRQLPLPTITWDRETVVSSWANSYHFDNYPAIWAPVVYGKLLGPFAGVPFVDEVKAFSTKDMRPAVYVRAIIDAIFTEHLGYTIKSDFFNTDFFEELVYLFGVGNEWKNGSDFASQKVTVRRDTQQSISPSNYAFVSFDIEVNDPNDLFAVDTFTAPFTGEFAFTFEGTTVNIFPEIGVQTFIGGSPNQNIGFQNLTDIGGTQDWSFSGTINLEAGEQALFIVLGGANSPSIEYALANWSMLDTVTIGSEINLASCLHSQSSKDFLRAITHAFCLAWFVDPIRKVIECEPRFPVSITEQALTTHLAGFYSTPRGLPKDRIIEHLDVDTSREIVKSIESPFGDSVAIGYKKDNNDALVEFANSLASEFPGAYNVSRSLQSRGLKSTTIENNMFTDLYVANHDRHAGGHLPTVMPSSFDLAQSLDEPPPDATYQSDPKLAIISRNSAYIYFENSQGGNTSSARTDVPLAIQKITQNRADTIITDPIRWKQSLSFASHNVVDLETGEIVDTYPGLFESFHRQYFSIISDGITLKTFIKRNFISVITENFRRLKNLNIGGVNQLYILMEMSGFKPQSIETTKHYFVRYRSTTVDDVDKETQEDGNIGLITINYGDEPEPVEE